MCKIINPTKWKNNEPQKGIAVNLIESKSQGVYVTSLWGAHIEFCGTQIWYLKVRYIVHVTNLCTVRQYNNVGRYLGVDMSLENLRNYSV